MAEFTGSDLTCVRGEREVFAGLGFAVVQGAVLVLRGANGSGKSSLLRLMAGLLPPAAGTLCWAGAPVADDPDGHRRRVGFLGHADAVKPALTPREDVAFWAGWRRRGDGADTAAEALARFGLRAQADMPCRFLSAGQRRRLALARVLAGGAPLWLLDEPLVGLDAPSRAALAEAVAGHCAGGGLAVVATHQPLDLGAVPVAELALGGERR